MELRVSNRQKKKGEHMEETKNLKFKGYLVEHGIKQSDIADLLELDLSNVNLKINGKQPWTLAQIKEICLKYNISANEYFF